MKYFKIALIVLILPLLAMSSSVHKFYVSITKVEYIEEEETLQIIAKIFTEDLENTLRERYHPEIYLDSKKETQAEEDYILKYINKKVNIKVNDSPVTLDYIGKEYDNDIIKIYFEVKNVSALNSFEIENRILMEMFQEQQNIIHFKKNKLRKSLTLDVDNPNAVLNFN